MHAVCARRNAGLREVTNIGPARSPSGQRAHPLEYAVVVMHVPRPKLVYRAWLAFFVTG